jgi:hypothetical protein
MRINDRLAALESHFTDTPPHPCRCESGQCDFDERGRLLCLTCGGSVRAEDAMIDPALLPHWPALPSEVDPLDELAEYEGNHVPK